MTPPIAETDDPVLEVEDVRTHFPIRSDVFSRATGHVLAVDGVSFTIRKGETLSLVGESGCGKTTVGRTILKLVEPTAGRIRFRGVDITRFSAREMHPLRRDMQLIHQDPYSSLNPRMKVGSIVGEPLVVNTGLRGARLQQKIEHLLERVGLQASRIGDYPHQFSGGQRQRICIARALALEPQLVVCDEAVSALDVSVQAQITNLMMDLQRETNLSYLFISHDLAVVDYVSHRIGVMYLGRLVEITDRRSLFAEPLHPYTQALLSSLPAPEPRRRRDGPVVLEGDVPSPVRPPAGCRFHTRCPMVHERCRVESPDLKEIRPQHWVSCHLHDAGTHPAPQPHRTTEEKT